MPTATAVKTKKHTVQKTDVPPLPPTARIVEIAGRDCVIVPLDEYDDWLQDALLAAIGADRLKNQEGGAIPFEEAVLKLGRKTRAPR